MQKPRWTKHDAYDLVKAAAFWIPSGALLSFVTGHSIFWGAVGGAGFFALIATGAVIRLGQNWLKCRRQV